MDNETKDMMHLFGGVILVFVVGLIGVIWTELDKNDKCAQLINNPNLDVQKHEDVIQKLCR